MKTDDHLQEEKVSWEEVEIPLKWGIIRGKKFSRIISSADPVRVLGLHGWLDNCNSFDNLVHCLSDNIELLVIDMPGHGLSDHLPLAAKYDMLTYALSIRNAMISYEWNRFILMSHSLSVRIGHFINTFFPELIEAFIMIDAPIGQLTPFSLKTFQNDALQFNKLERHSQELQPSYTEKEVIQRLVESRVFLSNKNPSLDVPSAKILMNRAVKPVQNKPGYYIWRHDPRAKIPFSSQYTKELLVSVAKSLTCPILYIQADNGIYPIKEGLYPKGILELHNIYRTHSSYFENVELKGMHHLHMTHAPEVATVINSFINKVIEMRKPIFNSKL